MNKAPKVWIRKRKTGKGVSYSLRWREGEVIKSECLGRIGKELAEKLRRQKEYEISSASTHMVTDISYKKFVDGYSDCASLGKAPATIAMEKSILNELESLCHPQTVSGVNDRVIEAYMRHKLAVDHASKHTVNKILRTLRAVLSRAVHEKYLAENPVKKEYFLDAPQKPIRVLTAKEVEALINASPNRAWQLFIYLAVSCGLGVSELCNLRWVDIDMDVGLVHIRNRDDWTTKGRRNRVVGLTQRAKRYLQLHKARNRQARFVFENREGRRWHNNIRRSFGAILEKAKIPKCTLHDQKPIKVRLNGIDCLEKGGTTANAAATSGVELTVAF